MKRYLIPAFLALAFHGLLFTVRLPGQRATVVRPAAIPVEIAIRQLEVKSAATSKEAAPHPLPKSVPMPPRPQPLKKKKPVQPERVPPKKKVEEKLPARKKTALAPRLKESKIKTEKEEPVAAPATLRQATKTPGKMQPQPAATAAEIRETQPVTSGATSPTVSPVASPGKTIGHRQAIPAYQRNRQPEYPPVARRRGLSGSVLLKVLVDAKGQVADLAVERSSGHRLLDRAALHAVRQWLFSPAIEDGMPVAMWVSVPITFQLQEQ